MGANAQALELECWHFKFRYSSCTINCTHLKGSLMKFDLYRPCETVTSINKLTCHPQTFPHTVMSLSLPTVYSPSRHSQIVFVLL